MKILWFFLVLFFVLTFFGMGYVLIREDSVQEAVQGYPFTLRLGDSVLVKDTTDASGREYVVEILGVEDSRCPSDVVCIQLGSAVVKIKVDFDEGTSFYEMNTQDAEPVLLDDHGTLRLVQVDPYPLSTKHIALSEYVVTLVVAHA